MTTSVVGTTNASVAQNTTTDITLPGTPASGDFVILVSGSGSGTPTVNTSGYTQVVDSSTCTVWWKHLTGSDTVVNVTTGTIYQAQFAIGVYRGANYIDDLSTISGSNAGMPDCPAVTSLTDGAMIVAVAGWNSDISSGGAAPSGYSNYDEGTGTGQSAVVASMQQTSAGTEDPGQFGGTTSGGLNKGRATFALRDVDAGMVFAPDAADLVLDGKLHFQTGSTDNHNRTVPGGDVAISTTAPAASVSDVSVVNPPAADLLLSTTAPVVEIIVASWNVLPANGDLSLSTAAPTVTESDYHPTQPSAADLLLTTTAPTVQLSEAGVALPAASDVLLSSSAPSVSISDVQAAAPASADLALSTTAPSVAILSLDYDVQPAAADLRLSSTAPDVGVSTDATSATASVASYGGTTALASYGGTTAEASYGGTTARASYGGTTALASYGGTVTLTEG